MKEKEQIILRTDYPLLLIASVIQALQLGSHLPDRSNLLDNLNRGM